MRHRATGILFVLSGTCFLAGVLDPPILPTWGGSAADVMATASAHRAAWFASTWLITLSIAAGLAARPRRPDRIPRDRPQRAEGEAAGQLLHRREPANP